MSSFTVLKATTVAQALAAGPHEVVPNGHCGVEVNLAGYRLGFSKEGQVYRLERIYKGWQLEDFFPRFSSTKAEVEKHADLIAAAVIALNQPTVLIGDQVYLVELEKLPTKKEVEEDLKARAMGTLVVGGAALLIAGLSKLAERRRRE